MGMRRTMRILRKRRKRSIKQRKTVVIQSIANLKNFPRVQSLTKTVLISNPLRRWLRTISFVKRTISSSQTTNFLANLMYLIPMSRSSNMREQPPKEEKRNEVDLQRLLKWKWTNPKKKMKKKKRRNKSLHVKSVENRIIPNG